MDITVLELMELMQCKVSPDIDLVNITIVDTATIYAGVVHIQFNSTVTQPLTPRVDGSCYTVDMHTRNVRTSVARCQA